MGNTVRSTSSCLAKLVGFAVVLTGISLGGAALMADADASIQTLMGVFALGGLLIAVVGGILMGLGALLGRTTKTAPAAPALSPEQQQLRDSQDFLAAQREE